MTPFNTALNSMSQSTPKAILPKTQPVAKPLTVQPPINRKPAAQNAQVAAYGKAMNQAIKNTKLYK